MPAHILLSYATRRPYKLIPEMPEDAKYDPSTGFWVINDEPLVGSDLFGLETTKKCDQETGEDQKGE